MSDLIAALTIFLKYGNPDSPTHCTHDVLYVAIHPSKVSAEDIATLKELGFSPGEDDSEHDGGFYSFRFGSC